MNLKIYTDEVEDLALRQIHRLLAQPAFAGAKVRIMPDVHAGKGCVIGANAFITKSVAPCTTVSIKNQELQMKTRSSRCETCKEPCWEKDK